jgi:hypothetical protein
MAVRPRIQGWWVGLRGKINIEGDGPNDSNLECCKPAGAVKGELKAGPSIQVVGNARKSQRLFIPILSLYFQSSRRGTFPMQPASTAGRTSTLDAGGTSNGRRQAGRDAALTFRPWSMEYTAGLLPARYLCICMPCSSAFVFDTLPPYLLSVIRSGLSLNPSANIFPFRSDVQ